MTGNHPHLTRDGSPPPRRPGRPCAGQDNAAVRTRLLECAREQFAQFGYAGVSLRRLAGEAHTNPAMVGYYFGNKQGLFLAILAEHVEPLLAHLAQALADTRAEGRQTLHEFLDIFAHTLYRTPWLSGLVLREVLPGQGALHQVFIDRFAHRGANMLRTLITREQHRGNLPASLDPSITALTIASQIWFPFLARPLASQVFADEFDAHFIAGLVEQILRGLYGDAVITAGRKKREAKRL